MLTYDKTIPNEIFTKTKPFELLDNVFSCETRTSFLYLNTDYFCENSERLLRVPPIQINCAYLPPNHGCIAYEYLNGNISPVLMEYFQKAYSLDNPNREILRSGYLVGIDYPKMLEMLTSKDSKVNTAAKHMLIRDYHYLNYIQMAYTAERFLDNENARIIFNRIFKTCEQFSQISIRFHFPSYDLNFQSEDYISEKIKDTNAVTLYQQFYDDMLKRNDEQLDKIIAYLEKQEALQIQSQQQAEPQNQPQQQQQ